MSSVRRCVWTERRARAKTSALRTHGVSLVSPEITLAAWCGPMPIWQTTNSNRYMQNANDKNIFIDSVFRGQWSVGIKEKLCSAWAFGEAASRASSIDVFSHTFWSGQIAWEQCFGQTGKIIALLVKFTRLKKSAKPGVWRGWISPCRLVLCCLRVAPVRGMLRTNPRHKNVGKAQTSSVGRKAKRTGQMHIPPLAHGRVYLLGACLPAKSAYVFRVQRLRKAQGPPGSKQNIILVTLPQNLILSISTDSLKPKQKVSGRVFWVLSQTWDSSWTTWVNQCTKLVSKASAVI